MFDIKLSMLKAILKWKTAPSKLKRYLDSLPFDLPALPEPKDKPRVTALQMKLFLAETIADYIIWLVQPILEARKAGSHLVLLPENVSLPLLGLIPGLDKQADEGLEGELRPGDVFRFVSPYFFPVYYTVLSYLAGKTGMYIAGGSMPTVEEGFLYNMGIIFNPAGRPILQQKKLNLMPIEEEWGMTRGEKLEIVASRLGTKIAMPICMDATYFETFRLAYQRGAEIILIPIADPNPQYSEHMAWRGIWARVQETPVYGIKSALVGNLLSFKLTGKAGIFAPAVLTAREDGVVAIADNPEEPAIISAQLDLAALRQVQEDWPAVNEDLYRKYRYNPDDNL